MLSRRELDNIFSKDKDEQMSNITVKQKEEDLVEFDNKSRVKIETQSKPWS